jgi:hypothetical protein
LAKLEKTLNAFACLLLLALPPEPVETKFAQVGPVTKDTLPFQRTAERQRAVVLLHGLHIHPFNSGKVAKAEWHGWQKPESILVKTLAKDSDVFAFAYGQNVAVDDIAAADGLGGGIRQLKQLGYSEVVLVGHSAGGIVARQFVEDQPDAGVTKVIQVCTPNGGSSWGKATIGVRQKQEIFLTSLTKDCRQLCLAKRCDKKIPTGVDFVCVIGQLQVSAAKAAEGEGKVAANKSLGGDGIVSCVCQWTKDLQEQCVPAVAIDAAHFSAMRSQASADKIAQLVRERQIRWDPVEVAAARKKLLGDKESR